MVHILGGAQTDFERNFKKEGKNVICLLKEVINDGFKDANFSFNELKKLNRINRVEAFVGNFIAECFIGQSHLGSILTEVDKSFYGVPSTRYEAACASGSAALLAAISKIDSGDIDVAIVVGFEMMKCVDSKTCGDILGKAAYYEKEAKDVVSSFPKLFDKLTDVILNKYPNLKEDELLNCLSLISSINYKNAKRNDNAQTRKWFMNLKESLARGSSTNPFVGKRLGTKDCSQITDGACCVILCSDKYIKRNNIKNNVVVKGYGYRVAPLIFDKKIDESKNSKYIFPWTRQACLDAYKKSGLTVNDIDCFETHDCFTTSEYISISAFGITKPGKEYEAVKKGIIDFDGKKPINPSGGLIGGGHPVGATGVRMFLDIYKQVSDKAGKYQIRNARNAMMLNFGGTITSNFTFIVGKK